MDLCVDRNAKTDDMTAPAHTNDLIGESSPYLLQHAHNPVDWMPWGEKAMEKAKRDNKLILVSIGYSTCHWCHVMERESFAREEVAEVMNKHFVCIKIDREERPDLDRIYMDAVTMMGRQGGWPLHCITTPQGEPVYGGTYFRRDRWVEVLESLAELWKTEPHTLREYGGKVKDGLQFRAVFPALEDRPPVEMDVVVEAVEKWKPLFDNRHGGNAGAPKFPLPDTLLFLLEYAQAQGDGEVARHVERTLDAMAAGGIHDHVGGGFARYATDEAWKVPHFEKMLYDNARLMSLYAAGHAFFGKPWYREVAARTGQWLKREMLQPEGGYAAALDADSEGQEGKFYTWTPDLTELSPDDRRRYAALYRTDDGALWDGRRVVMLRDRFGSGKETAGTDAGDPLDEYRDFNEKLRGVRESKVRPATDRKRICSWNALLATGWLAAYRHGCCEEGLDEARRILRFIESDCTDHATGLLKHIAGKREGSPDFLEDYAFAVEAYLALYASDFDETHLLRARELAMTAMDRFYDPEGGYFRFSPHDAENLIASPVDVVDDVMPSSNAVMAENLLVLGVYFDRENFAEIARRMVAGVEGAVKDHCAGYARWAGVTLRLALGLPELVVAGPDAREFAGGISSRFMPSVVLAAAERSRLPLFEGRLGQKNTRAYLCRHRKCDAPTASGEETLQALQKIYRRF